MSDYSKATELLYTGLTANGMDFGDPLTIPYYGNTAFKASTVEEMQKTARERYSYLRFKHPNRDVLAQMVTFLEEGEGSLIFSSGMGAITTTLMTLLAPGDAVICNSNIYGETFQVMTEILPKFGVQVDMADLCSNGNAEKAMRPETKMIYTEVCANPVHKMADSPFLADLIHKNGGYLMVDNAFTTPIAIRPLRFGADIVINSLTKFMNGHSDAIEGSITSTKEIIENVKHMQALYGTAGDPYAAWTMYKNFGTMDLRVRRQQLNANRLAEALEKHPNVLRVNHPSLDSFPQKELAQKLFKNKETMSGMLSVVLPEGEGGKEPLLYVNQFTKALKFVRFAGTMGGIHTTITNPVTSSHIAVPDDKRRAMGITPGMIRISCGIEDTDDLIREFTQALDSIER